jgi:hypothetical protein
MDSKLGPAALLLLAAALSPPTAAAQRTPQPVFTERFTYDPTAPPQLLGYIEGLNRLVIERGFRGITKTLPDGRTVKLPEIRLSDTEVIKMALSYAHWDAWARKQGLVTMLDDC